MAGFLPFAGKNSIVEAMFSLQFGQLLNPAVGAAFDALRAAFIQDFPKFEKMQMLQLTLGVLQQQETAAPVAGGFNASRFRADGNLSRAFRAVNNTLSLHFFEYDHWEDVKVAALGYFDRCFSVINVSSGQFPITAVVLRFVDRFTYDGQPEDASAAELLNADTRFVPKAIFNAAIPWQLNLSWTADFLAEKKVQHQLHIQGAKDTNPFIMIHHNMHVSLFPFLMTSEGREGEKNGTVATIFDGQHAENAMLLKDMLNRTALQDIGLGGDS